MMREREPNNKKTVEDASYLVKVVLCVCNTQHDRIHTKEKKEENSKYTASVIDVPSWRVIRQLVISGMHWIGNE
jgi:hypothetical protein